MHPNALERYSDLIGSIYDCVIEPERWPSVIAAIREPLNLATGILSIQTLPSGAPLMFVPSGVPEEYLRLIPGLSSEILPIWGGAERVSRFPLDEPVVQSHQTPRESWVENRWYAEWGRPQGLFDVVVVMIASDRASIGSLGFGRAISAGEIGEVELSALRLIAPHVRRSVTIGRLLDLKSIALASFASAVDALAAGVALVDADMRCIHLNAAAERLIEKGSPLVLIGGKVATLMPAASEALAAAVRVAATDEAELGRRGLGIPLRDADGEAFVIHVLPLGRREIRQGLSQNAVAALFVAPAAAGPQLPADTLALLYDLTPAETRVALLVSAGRAPGEIARDLGIGVATVKTHLLRAFEKTGCRRQVDLVRLIGSLAVPV